ncbi:hypothetical protein C5C13_11745 [Clavibacter michiganensis]|nr:hypothetical protein C5C13_11745 [Clavibacter michiganensis]
MNFRVDEQSIVDTVGDYFGDLMNAARIVDVESISIALEHIKAKLSEGRSLYVAGNGGSASSASHLVSDWLEASRNALGSSRVFCLGDNLAVLSRIANDISYEHIFSRYLESLGAEGDVLLLLSVGGKSRNLVHAATVARERGMTVVSFLGQTGDLAELSDSTVVLGSGDYGLTEDLHLSLVHAFVRCLNDGRPQLCAELL